MWTATHDNQQARRSIAKAEARRERRLQPRPDLGGVGRPEGSAQLEIVKSAYERGAKFPGCGESAVELPIDPSANFVDERLLRGLGSHACLDECKDRAVSRESFLDSSVGGRFSGRLLVAVACAKEYCRYIRFANASATDDLR